MPLRSRLLALGAAVLLAACAATPAVDPGVPQRIAFIDTDSFDKQLHGALGARAGSVEIAMLAPASVNNLPPRLSRVISTVQDAGGKVTLSPAPAGTTDGTAKSLSLLSLLPALVNAVQDYTTRQAYRDYDATVTVEAGQVTRVQLVKR